MKNYQKIFAALAFCMFLSATLTAQSYLTPAQKSGSPTVLPSLSGAEAVDRLKQSGQYDSLMEAVKAARRADGQTEQLMADDAFTQQAKLNNPEPAQADYFGNSVAISGDTVIVGASRDDGTFTDEGSAYVFVRSGAVWTQQAKLTAADAAVDDNFGNSVAISGDTAIVGALYDDGPFFSQGSAYVFVRSGAVWTQQAKLTASDAAEGDVFGISVVISGDTVIVGAAGDDGTFSNQGSAYVFVRSGAVWSQQAKLTALDAAANDSLGNSVAISGNTVVVGAYLDDGAFLDQGSAYVFVGSGATWSQQAKLDNPEPAASDRYSYSSVAISGDTAVVGAEADDGTFTDQGSAYVFVRSGATWSQQAKLDNPEPAVADRYGNSVTISGDTVIVGNNYDNGTFPIQGSAYVFVRSAAAWTQQAKLTASDAALGDNFGISVAISGNTAIVGAYSDNGTFSDQGSAYVFQNLAPTAASVSVSGRVSDANGRGISKARVTIQNAATGASQTVLTNPFGFYGFAEVLVGEVYILSAEHKRYQFSPRVITVLDEIADADLHANP